MSTEVVMPKVDMIMETGTLIEWLKKEGEHVDKGEPLFVINTDKAAIEVESTADGILSGVKAKPNDVIPVSEVIAYILGAGETLPGKTTSRPAAAIATSAAVNAPAAVEATLAAVETVHSSNVRATPVARRMAKKMQVDLTQLTGRGPRGRIQKADVLACQKSLAEPASVPALAAIHTAPVMAPIPASVGQQPAIIPLPDARRKQVVPLTGPRKIIAERMSYSASTAPHINISLRVDMTEAIRLRERLMEPLKAQTGQRLSYTAILARAVATVLPRHSYLNASLCGGDIILWEDIHLGIATSVDENLIVPVIREAQNRNLAQIVTVLADLTDRARNRRLKPAEMSGSTFTISNLGMFGVESFTAIINPPESAIMAVGKMVDTPVKTADGFEFRPMIQLTVSADHRVIDGAGVARFLEDLKSNLENPYLLI